MQMYITDKTGIKLWNTSVSEKWSFGERRNLEKHLNEIKRGNPAYAKVIVDRETAKIAEEYDQKEIIERMSADELLAELGG